MQPLLIRPTGRQLIRLTLVAGAFAAVALAILLARYVADASSLDVLVRYGAAAAIDAPLAGWAAISYARSFTKCDASAISSRGPVGGAWRCSWEFVAEIAVRASSATPGTRTVVVRTTGGDQIQLGMPRSSGAMPDLDFDAKVRQIRACWHAAMGTDGGPDAAAATPVVTGGPPALTWAGAVRGGRRRMSVAAAVRAYVAALVLATLVTLVVTAAVGVSGPALLVRLGNGQRGSFTATTNVCQTTCFWTGDFQPHDGSAARVGVAMAPGAESIRVGKQLAAVYPGGGHLVYPPGGGSTWIPLAASLLVLACSLPLALTWTLQWRRRAKLRPAALDYRPGGAPPPAQRTVTSTLFGVILGLEIAALTFAGIGVGIEVSLVPLSPSPSAVACASYRAWVLAQPDTGAPERVPALLSDAAQEDPSGQLGADLATLQADVGSATAAPQGELGLGAQAIVLTDMSQVTRDCGR